MGMYDCVIVKCPRCSRDVYFQSKGGECLGRNYEVHEAPADVLQDADRHGETCEGCGLKFGLKVEMTVRVTPEIVWGET